MLTGLIRAHASELTAGLILLPVLVVHVAMFLERSGTSRRARSQPDGGTGQPPTLQPGQQRPAASAGGVGLRRVSAATP